MKTVEIVIRIPKKEYYYMISNPTRYNVCDDETLLYNYIKNGTILPKGHGRLGDLDRLVRTEIQHLLYHLPNGDIAVPKIDIDNAPTILEADKEVSE